MKKLAKNMYFLIIYLKQEYISLSNKSGNYDGKQIIAVNRYFLILSSWYRYFVSPIIDL